MVADHHEGGEQTLGQVVRKRSHRVQSFQAVRAEHLRAQALLLAVAYLPRAAVHERVQPTLPDAQHLVNALGRRSERALLGLEVDAHTKHAARPLDRRRAAVLLDQLA